MQLKSLNGCRLSIGSYPTFDYNADEGGGKATLIKRQRDKIIDLSFSPQTFSIPPLT